MIIRPFFRRHFWMTAIVFFTIITGASLLSRYMNHLERVDFYKSQGGLFLKVVERHGGDKLAYIKELNATNHELGIPVEVDVIDNGRSLLTNEPRSIPAHGASEKVYMHPIYVDASTKPATFLVDYIHGGRKRALYMTFAIMFVAIILASMLSMFLLFWSFRDRAELAKNVLLRMQQGDLKARFPTTRLDEVGHMMTLFNQMADEIERLVERLKANETHRIQLLQELTHDLRTPVASLRNLIETLRFEDTRLQLTAKAELMDLAYQETEYLTRLVEDLLFLALVLEPKYKEETGRVSLYDVLEAQLAATSAAHPNVRSEAVRNGAGKRHIVGNSHLMQRLVRNGLENAFSFARSKVETSLHCANGSLSVVIRDDGPGLSKEALETFGKKRSTRYQVSQGEGGRLSVGLGSVIMQAIANAHGGQVTIQNLIDGEGKIRGSELTITIRGNDKTA